MEPQRPARPQELAQKRGPLPARTNYQPILESMCKA